MWGSRKKREDDDEITAPEMPDILKNEISSDVGSVGSGDFDITTFMDTYIGMMEKMMDSPEFDSMLTPEVMGAMFNQMPQLANNPEVVQMLDSPQFKDPVLLRQTISEGLKAMRQYTSQIAEMMQNPEQLQALISQLPEEYQGIVQRLVAGDVSGLKNMITSLPGLNASQRQMLGSMLDGDSKGLANTVEQMMNDPDQVEAARQQFLADPSM
eukprot:gene4548-6020_t